MKNNKKWWFFIPGALGLILSRMINTKYGEDARNKVGIIILVVIILYLIFSIVYFLVKKYYWLTIGILTIFTPMIICIIGLYKENYPLMIKGLIVLLLIMVGWYIFLKLHVKNKNK